MACGAWDRDIAGRVFWMGQFGVKPTADQVERMNPLRQVEKPPPPPKSEAERKLESKIGWAAVRQFFHQKRK